MVRRTKQGLLLEKLLHGMKHRYLLCWNGEEEDSLESPYDCACCGTWPDEDLYRNCGCICHTRIESMSSSPHIKLWLLAAKSMEEFPVIFHSEDEWFPHGQEIRDAHAAQAEKYGYDPCNCEECVHVRTVEKRKASEPVATSPEPSKPFQFGEV